MRKSTWATRRDSDDRTDAVGGARDLPLAPLDMAWSFTAAEANEVLGGADGTNWARFEKAHMFVDRAAITERGEPTRGDFKVPFAKMVGGSLKAVWRGLVAARGALGGARSPLKGVSPEDKKKAQGVIDGYARKINKTLPEGEPPKPLSTDDRSDGGDYVQRYDRASFIGKPFVRPDGTVLFTARVAKPGILVYRDTLGRERRELVTEENLHQVDSLATLARSTVTLEHPDEDVTPDNVGEVGVGDVDGFVETEESGGFVTVRLAVRRRDALDAIKRGKREVSPGYRLQIDETPGTHEVFGHYDAIQGPRIYNHVAIVETARGGPGIRLRTDGAAYQISFDADDSQTTDQRVEMKPLLIALLTSLGVSDVSSEDGALTTAKGRVDSLNAFLRTALQSEDVRLDDIGSLQKTLDKMKSADQAKKDEGLEELKKKLQLSEDALGAMTGERDTLKKAADKLHDDQKKKTDADERERLDAFCKAAKVRVDGADALELIAYKKAIVVASVGEVPEDASDAYIVGALNATVTARADAMGIDRGNMWVNFADFGDKTRRTDATQTQKRKDDEDTKTPSQNWQENADAAFKAARGGN